MDMGVRMLVVTSLFVSALSSSSQGSDSLNSAIWRNPDAKLQDRLDDLLPRLTVDELIDSLHANRMPTGAIDRLNIPGFTGWNECLHGGVDSGNAKYGMTSFPQPLGLAATFDRDLLHDIAGIISDEMRAVSNLYRKADGTARALNCFGPNINIIRDPRWGRASETYGEDPHLTEELAAAFVTGLQSNDSHYLKVSATCKHFAAYSLEVADSYTRAAFDAHVSDRDLEASYTPAFKACVGAGARSVMCSYNALNGEPTCASPRLLQDRLRDSWGFDGFVVSDCGAVDDVVFPHRFANSSEAGNAAALAAGTDMNCVDYGGLRGSYAAGLVTRKQLELAARRIFEHKLRLGVLDPPERVPFSAIPSSVIGAPSHRRKAVQAAQKSIVLLKNAEVASTGKKLLPLDPRRLRKVVLAGPHANSSEHLLGNYYDAVAGRVTTPLQAFQAALGADKVVYKGTPFQPEVGADGPIDAATGAAADADAIILFLGTSAINTHTASGPGYEMLTLLTEGEGYDRRSLTLPGTQEVLALQLARMTQTPIIIVLVHGGPVDVQPLAESPRVGAILTTWFPGQGGQAIADVILGVESPSGRLPVTFYYNNYTAQVKMSDFDMRAWPGRTHRYLQVPVLYPFGYGLSYSSFEYSGLSASHARGLDGRIAISAAMSIRNTGSVEAEDVVLAYLVCRAPAFSRLLFWRQQGLGHRALGDFRRIRLKPGEQGSVLLNLTGDNVGNMLVRPGARVTAALRGSLALQAGSQCIALPQLSCLLTSPSRAQEARVD